MPRVYLTRRECFSSAHRLESSALTEEKNREIYGKCNNPHGHGHNYVMEVTVAGQPDRNTGMVMNVADLKEIMEEKVMKLLDHRNIDREVRVFMEGLASTAENLAIFIWDQLEGSIPSPARLHEVKLWETEKNIVVYRGEE